MEKFKKTNYPSIASSNILTEEEMSNTLGGACDKCKPMCKEDCKPGRKTVTQADNIRKHNYTFICSF